jgi:Flp pilus assembly protein TadD
MSVLDAEELLHLGLHATNSNDPHKALEYLKECLELEPENPSALHLLGALYAQLGMYDRARQILQRTVELYPEQHTAVFQLGLLELTSGAVESARLTWAALDRLGSDHYLVLFKSGMLALVADDFAACSDFIERGVQANTTNAALNNDMRKVQAEAQAAAGKAAPGAADAPLDGAAVSHLMLSGYQQASEKNR